MSIINDYEMFLISRKSWCWNDVRGKQRDALMFHKGEWRGLYPSTFLHDRLPSIRSAIPHRGLWLQALALEAWSIMILWSHLWPHTLQAEQASPSLFSRMRFCTVYRALGMWPLIWKAWHFLQPSKECKSRRKWNKIYRNLHCMSS